VKLGNPELSAKNAAAAAARDEALRPLLASMVDPPPALLRNA
jgi:hypothetical protein